MMKFNIRSLGLEALAPREAVIQVGRFQVALDHDPTMLGGLSWEIVNADAIRDGEFPVQGKIDRTGDVHARTMLFLSELGRYDRHLAVEAEIDKNPAKYEKLAAAAMKAEEGEAKRVAKAEAMAAAEAAELEAERVKEAEAQVKAEELALQREADEQARIAKEERLARRMREAAALELSHGPA